MTPWFADDWYTILVGDARTVLASMEPESVQCVVTSPPYWGLRDYGVDGQLGLEPTPEAYVEAMVKVFREVRRVLRKDGTLWLNLGDSYATGNTSEASNTHPSRHQKDVPQERSVLVPRRLGGLKAKDRLLMPARVALALQADGWWVRDEVIWSKPNPMPSSVRDRTTPAHEMVYLLTRSARYYYDGTAIAELAGSEPRGDRIKVPGGWDTAPGSHDGPHRAGRTSATYVEPKQWPGIGPKHGEMRDRGEVYEPMETYITRNKRSVWTVATEPYPAAHFATFPRKLIEPMILAGCPAECCAECGAPFVRLVDRGDLIGTNRGGNYIGREDEVRAAKPLGTRLAMNPGTPGMRYENKAAGWVRGCNHDGDPVPGVVLDPFAGSGTVGLVSQLLGRRSVLIDLNAEYAQQMLDRREAFLGRVKTDPSDQIVAFDL